MAELMFPDIAGSFQQGQRLGTLQRLQGEGEQRRSTLASLAQQAYSAPQDQRQGIIGQAVGVDPEEGFALEKGVQGSEDARTRSLVNAAKLLTSAPDAQRPGLYQQMRPGLAQFGLQLPDQYDDTVAQTAQALVQAYGGGQPGGRVQSTYIDAQGNRVAIMADGTTQILGQNAPNNQIIDTGNGFFGVNKGTLNAAPVNIGGGQPQGPQAPIPGAYIDPSLPPEVQAQIRQSETTGQPIPDQMYFGGGSQLRSAPKPAAVPAGYRDDGQGGLMPIPGGPAQVAIDARADAAAAKKAAEEAKALQKQQAADARQAAAVEASNGLIGAIDSLTSSEGFGSLGTAMGDVLINAPLVRNSAKDANAQLKNVAGQVALATMSRLKALSSTGATGFGSLTAPELRLLENSIATLQSENISNAELKRSLRIIRDTMAKTTEWKAPQGSNSAPADDDDALIGKYLD